MAELDTVSVHNPLDHEFQVRFNGEIYTLPANSSRQYPQFLAFHIAKHLSDSMLRPEAEKTRKSNKENPYNPALGQLIVYDNPKRRIALYDIFGSRELVDECIANYPFKGFIGEISEYEEYVAKAEKKGKTETPATVEATA